FLTGGEEADSEIATTEAPGGFIKCDDLVVPLGLDVPGPALLAGAANGAGACIGSGLGVIAGASTVQVQFVPNQLPPSNAALTAFCDDIINHFQATVKAETDLIATLTVSNHTNTELEAAVDATDALIQKLLAEAPLEIRPQVVILTNGLQQLNEGLRAASFNTATLGQANLTLIQQGLANPPANPEIDAA